MCDLPSGSGTALAPMTLMSVDLPDPFWPMKPYLHTRGNTPSASCAPNHSASTSWRDAHPSGPAQPPPSFPHTLSALPLLSAARGGCKHSHVCKAYLLP